MTDGESVGLTIQRSPDLRLIHTAWDWDREREWERDRERDVLFTLQHREQDQEWNSVQQNLLLSTGTGPSGEWVCNPLVPVPIPIPGPCPCVM